MKLGEARQLYSVKLQEYWDQKLSLAKKKKELESESNSITNNEQVLKEAATLEISYQAVSEKCDEYQTFMEQLMEIHTGLYNAEVAKQQSNTISDSMDDLAKIMEVARRIARGGKVPAADEMKLMKYSMALYMSAKNAAMMNEMKEKKQYESLWDDDDEIAQNPDPNEVADNVELGLDAPEVVDVADVLASAASDGTTNSEI